jgi:NifU-like protein involved in Fe-S cluster formation
MNKLFLTLFIGILFSCSSDDDNPETEQSSIVGTWKIISLTSNGTEELQDELNGQNICYWTEVYTQTTITDIDFSGTNCTTENTDSDISTYVINGTTLLETYDNGQNLSLEILELTNTTLRLQDSYEEVGENYVDIYTYTKQ